MDSTPDQAEHYCANCGALAPENFCPKCGQAANVGLPGMKDLVREAFSAFLSYDSKAIRTVQTLVTQPGELTASYVGGVRVRYTNPFQMFVWLQAATFLVDRLFFAHSQVVSDTKSRDLLIFGVFAVAWFGVMHARRKVTLAATVVFVTHLWCFLMIVLLGVYVCLPLTDMVATKVSPSAHLEIGSLATWLGIVAMLLYTPRAVVRYYGDKTLLAIAQVALLVPCYYLFALAVDRFSPFNSAEVSHQTGAVNQANARAPSPPAQR